MNLDRRDTRIYWPDLLGIQSIWAYYFPQNLRVIPIQLVHSYHQGHMPTMQQPAFSNEPTTTEATSETNAEAGAWTIRRLFLGPAYPSGGGPRSDANTMIAPLRKAARQSRGFQQQFSTPLNRR